MRRLYHSGDMHYENAAKSSVVTSARAGFEGSGADSGACSTAQTPSLHDILNFSDALG